MTLCSTSVEQTNKHLQIGEFSVVFVRLLPNQPSAAENRQRGYPRGSLRRQKWIEKLPAAAHTASGTMSFG
jgi:hypothetical protein